MENKTINCLVARSLQTARANLLDSKELFKGKTKELEKVEKGLLILSNFLIKEGLNKEGTKRPKEDTIESTLNYLIVHNLITEEEYTADMDKVKQVRAIDNLRQVMSLENFVATLVRVQNRNEHPKEGNKPIEGKLKYVIACLNKEKGNFK